MKYYIPFLLLTVVVTTKPTPIGRGQEHEIKDTVPAAYNNELIEVIKKIDTTSDSLNDVKNDLFKEAFKNQKLISKKRPDKIIKIKPVAIPVPVPVTVYVKADKLEKKMDAKVINSTPKYDTVIIKKRSFFYRLFHHKKHKNETRAN